MATTVAGKCERNPRSMPIPPSATTAPISGKNLAPPKTMSGSKRKAGMGMRVMNCTAAASCRRVFTLRYASLTPAELKVAISL